MHDSAVNHGAPRRHWEKKLTCNMPILAWRWDINKLLKRRKIRIHFLQENGWMSLSVCLLHSLRDNCLLYHLAQGIIICDCVGWQWKVISGEVKSGGTNFEPLRRFHLFRSFFFMYFQHFYHDMQEYTEQQSNIMNQKTL